MPSARFGLHLTVRRPLTRSARFWFPKAMPARGSSTWLRPADLAPKRPDIRLNYARALVKAGRTEQARKELTALQAVADEFPGKSEIPALLKQL